MRACLNVKFDYRQLISSQWEYNLELRHCPHESFNHLMLCFHSYKSDVILCVLSGSHRMQAKCPVSRNNCFLLGLILNWFTFIRLVSSYCFRFGSLVSRLEKKPQCKGRSLELFLTYPMHQVGAITDGTEKYR